MSLDNVYRPPAELSTEVLVVSSPVPTFSEDGAALVGSLARWMSFLGAFYLAIAGLVGICVLIAFAFDFAVGLFALGIAAVVAVAVIAAGVWLRERAGRPHHGQSVRLDAVARGTEARPALAGRLAIERLDRLEVRRTGARIERGIDVEHEHVVHDLVVARRDLERGDERIGVELRVEQEAAIVVVLCERATDDLGRVHRRREHRAAEQSIGRRQLDVVARRAFFHLAVDPARNVAISSSSSTSGSAKSPQLPSAVTSHGGIVRASTTAAEISAIADASS